VLLKPQLISKVYRKLKITKVAPDGHAYYMETMWDYFSIKSKTLKKDRPQFVFLGDSIITVVCVESVFNGLNLGIAAETVKRAKEKVALIKNLDNKHIFLCYGINDIPGNTQEIVSDYSSLISALPRSSTVYISSILPIDEQAFALYSKRAKTNRQIKEVNALLEEYAHSSERIKFLHTDRYLLNEQGQLKSHLHKGDGIHLNEEGNKLWLKAIKEQIHRPSSDASKGYIPLPDSHWVPLKK
jgi:lysophospholipase L1-like esterase